MGEIKRLLQDFYREVAQPPNKRPSVDDLLAHYEARILAVAQRSTPEPVGYMKPEDVPRLSEECDGTPLIGVHHKPNPRLDYTVPVYLRPPTVEPQRESGEREVLQEVLSASVDESTYPDGPCLPKDLRDDIKALLATPTTEPTERGPDAWRVVHMDPEWEQPYPNEHASKEDAEAEATNLYNDACEYYHQIGKGLPPKIGAYHVAPVWVGSPPPEPQKRVVTVEKCINCDTTIRHEPPEPQGKDLITMAKMVETHWEVYKQAIEDGDDEVTALCKARAAAKPPPTVEPTESRGEAVEKRWRFRPFSMMAEEPLPWRYTTYDPRTVPCSAEPGEVEVLEWRPPEPQPDVMERDRPEVVCLCGSTRFADQHAIRRWELEQEGVIVLMINYLPHWWAEEQGWDGNDHFGERAGMKEMLDELHLRKIDLSNRVEIINPGGYVGESTVNEIRYALRIGKPVTYMVDELTGPGVAILSAQEGEG